jgi:hypothetical protein
LKLQSESESERQRYKAEVVGVRESIWERGNKRVVIKIEGWEGDRRGR